LSISVLYTPFLLVLVLVLEKPNNKIEDEDENDDEDDKTPCSSAFRLLTPKPRL